jgi:uncharacterized caspase-like protein
MISRKRRFDWKVAAAVLVAFLLLLAGTTGPRAEEARPLRGVALVIGNGKYAHLPALANPRNDADAIDALFSDLGFDAVRRTDRDSASLRRDLDRFVEDATDADVAVLYYAGHGIEAGGENFLVPVDADTSALDAAGERLVALADILQRLRASVPVTILLLDACRDNPFPPGATLRRAPASAPLPISAGGLAETRGARAIGAAAAASDNLGMVIGFAAEPGKAALDGNGDNSPYATALLRHVSAMAGEEFGTVMRMVAEEVYLATSGRQRPWINESLRRLLYFGVTPEAPAGDEGDILTERRQLLLTIAALPDIDRRQVERVASQGGVPMDAVFGMLKAMGAQAPDNREDVEEILRQESDRIRKILADRRALENLDPEVERLTALADRAELEGLVDVARRLRERAKARDDEIQSSIVDRAEAQVKAHRIASAALHARSAETYVLAFDHLKAAADYATAFERIERWDAEAAAAYKLSEADSLAEIGYSTNDADLQVRALAAYRLAADIAGRQPDRLLWGEAQNGLANALLLFAPDDPDLASAAMEGYERALSVFEGDEHAEERVAILNNLAVSLIRRGMAEQSQETLRRAASILETALADWPADGQARMRAQLLNNLGTAARAIWSVDGKDGGLDEAVARHEAALAALPRDDDPFEWAKMANNLGIAIQLRGEVLRDGDMLRRAIDVFGDALSVRTVDHLPLPWALTTNNRGFARILYGGLAGQPAEIESGLAEAGEALKVLRSLDADYYAAFVEDTICTGHAELASAGGVADLAGGLKACRSAIRAFAEYGLGEEEAKTAKTLARLEQAGRAVSP